MIAATKLKDAGKKSQAGFAEIEPAWSSDASPSSRRAVRFENIEDVSKSSARREQGFSPSSPTEKDQNAAYLKALRELSTEKQKRRRKEKNMLKLAQELGHRTEQVADRERQLEALKSEISALKKKLFDSANDESEERDQPGHAEESPLHANRSRLLPTLSHSEVKRLQDELYEKTQESILLEQNCADRSRVAEMLQSELSAKAEALRLTEVELKRERDDMAELRERISNLETACAKHIKEKNDVMHKMKSLETDLTSKHDFILRQTASIESTESENQLLTQATKAEIMELRETLKLTRALLMTSKEDAANHKQVLDNVQTEMTQKEDSLLSMQTELAQEKAEVERLIASNKNLEEQKTSISCDLEEARNLIISLKANLLDKDQLFQELRDELQRKEAHFIASMQTNDESLKVLQEECQSRDARLDTIMAELVCERSTLKTVEERRHLLEAECKALRIAKDLSMQQNDTLKDEIRALKSSAMVETLSGQSIRQLQTSFNFLSTEDEHVDSVIERETAESEERLSAEQGSRIEALENSRQTLLDDCNFLRLSLNKLEEENRCLLLKFDSDKKSFVDIETRIQTQQNEATLVREKLLGCKIEVQRLLNIDEGSSNGLADAERLLSTHAKSVSDMLSHFASITQTMEHMSRLEDMIEVLQQDLTKRDEKIAELQRGLHLLVSKESTIVKADERFEKCTINNLDCDLDSVKEESRQALEAASEQLRSVLSRVPPSDPAYAKLTPAVDRLQATFREILSQIIVRLDSEMASKIKMKVARDKAIQALSHNNGNMEEAAMKMKTNLEKLNQEHAKAIEELQGKLSSATQSEQDTIREHEAALRAVENKYISKFEKLGKKNEDLLTDFESHMQERIDKLGSKLDKKAARIRTLQRLVTYQLHTQSRGQSSRLPWFPILLVIFAAPLLVLFGKPDRQWVCAPVPPWEHYQSNKAQPWHTWWSSFIKAEEPSSHPWWKRKDNAHLDWLEVKLCQSNSD